jgi:sterol desaturase/sphingolipid hydroxylase (fatty acid hydroxylase superfamily)
MISFLNFSSVSFLGVFAAAIVAQFISAMWYGPLFEKQWKKYCRWSEEEFMKFLKTDNRHTKAIYVTFIEQLISMFALAVLIHSLHITTTEGAMTLGAGIWFAFMATMGINEVLWHNEKIGFYILNQSNYLVRTVAMAAVYSWITL